MNSVDNADNALFTEILRISPEPFAYFTERDIHRLLTEQPLAYFTYVKRALTDIAHGRASLDLTPKQVFADQQGGGDFRVMPCVLRGGDNVTKTVKLIGTNTRQSLIPDQITVGKAFALHPSENFVSHIFEACLLSSARTGLCASLAADHLANRAGHISIAGAGRVGYYAAFFCCSALPVELLEVIDVNRERARATAAQLSLDFPGIRVRTKKSLDNDASDILILATTSREALCTPDTTSAMLVVSLGADIDDQHELHQDWAKAARIFVDTHDTARYGDLRLWQDQKIISSNQITDVFQLLREQDQATAQQRKVFVSTGSALFDNLTIGYLLSEGVKKR